MVSYLHTVRYGLGMASRADWLNEGLDVLAADAASVSRSLVGDLDWITLKALERERDLRYASVSELAADIREVMAG